MTISVDLNLNLDLCLQQPPCLPRSMALAATTPSSCISGEFLLQLLDLRDVNSSAYSQVNAETTTGTTNAGIGISGGLTRRNGGGRKLVTVDEDTSDGMDRAGGGNRRGVGVGGGGGGGGGGCCWRLTLSDGHATVQAMCMEPIPGLHRQVPVGLKMRVVNPITRCQGQLWILTAKNTSILGGCVEPMASVWTYENRLRRRLGMEILVPEGVDTSKLGPGGHGASFGPHSDMPVARASLAVEPQQRPSKNSIPEPPPPWELDDEAAYEEMLKMEKMDDDDDDDDFLSDPVPPRNPRPTSATRNNLRLSSAQRNGVLSTGSFSAPKQHASPDTFSHPPPDPPASPKLSANTTSPASVIILDDIDKELSRLPSTPPSKRQRTVSPTLPVADTDMDLDSRGDAGMMGFDMHEWLPMSEIRVSSPLPIAAASPRKPPPPVGTRLSYLSDLPSVVPSDQPFFVKAVFTNIDGSLKFQTGVYEAYARISDGITTTRVQLSNELLQTWIGFPAADIVATLKTRNAAQLKEIKEKMEGVESKFMSSEGVFEIRVHGQVPEVMRVVPMDAQFLAHWLYDLQYPS